jgi:hypothetical protein
MGILFIILTNEEIPFLNKDDRIFLLGEGEGQTLQVLGRVSAHWNYLCTKTQQNGGQQRRPFKF